MEQNNPPPKLRHKKILVLLVMLVVIGLIQCLMTGSALFFLTKDTLLGINESNEEVLIVGGEDSDPVSRKRRGHVKEV